MRKFRILFGFGLFSERLNTNVKVNIYKVEDIIPSDVSLAYGNLKVFSVIKFESLFGNNSFKVGIRIQAILLDIRLNGFFVVR